MFSAARHSIRQHIIASAQAGATVWHMLVRAVMGAMVRARDGQRRISRPDVSVNETRAVRM